MSLNVRVPAKINLWLEVIRKRSDGYHDLSTLMLPIGIYDHVELSMEGEGIRLNGTHPDVPQDSRNLAWRAAEVYLREAGWNTGVQIRLTKNIPVGAGLGGGSADAGAVLLGLNRLCPSPLTPDQLALCAQSLGADVPFFLLQRPALATGIGEKLHVVEGVPEYPLVLIKPPLKVSTAWVYQRLKLTRGESRIKIAELLAHPWRLHTVMENDLETVTVAEYPLVDQIKRWLIEEGAVGAVMSGSGPTVFGVFHRKDRAEEVALLAEQKWGECWSAMTEVLSASPFDCR